MTSRLMIAWALAIMTGVYTVDGAADTARLGGRTYRDVYVASTETYTYILHPDTGEATRVPARRADINVVYTQNKEIRDELLARWRVKRDVLEQGAAITKAMREAAAQPYRQRAAGVPGEAEAAWRDRMTRIALRTRLFRLETLLRDIMDAENARRRQPAQYAESPEDRVSGLRAGEAQTEALMRLQLDEMLAENEDSSTLRPALEKDLLKARDRGDPVEIQVRRWALEAFDRLTDKKQAERTQLRIGEK